MSDTSGTVSAATSTLYWNAVTNEFDIGGNGVLGQPNQSATSSLLLLGQNQIFGGNSSGTFIGANASTGYNGDWVNLQINSSSVLQINANGSMDIATGTNGNSNALLTIATSSNIFTVLNNGSVGIDTANPSSMLQVAGTAAFGSTTIAGNETTTNLSITAVTNALDLGSGTGAITAYGGSTCAAGTVVASISATGTVICSTAGTVTTSTSGSVNFLPIWSGAASLGNSWISQDSNSVIIASGTGVWATASSSFFQLGSSSIQNGNALGTFIGINAASGFNGDFLNFQVNSSTAFQVASSGVFLFAGNGMVGGKLNVTGTATFESGVTMNSSLLIGTSTNPANSLLTIGTSTNIFTILGNGRVGIGTSTPSQALTVFGNIANLDGGSKYVSQVATTSITNSGGPSGIYVSGRYAYTANSSNNSISVIDISNPTAPVQVATTSVGTTPDSIYVAGRYAYVTNSGGATVSVVDISNPKLPIQVATTSVGTTPNSIYVSGHYAYVTNGGSNTVSVIDISNPVIPFLATTTTVGATPSSIYISGRYAYVANDALSGTMSVLDLANPKAPIQIATATVGTNPDGIEVSGRYAYLTLNSGNLMAVMDVSNAKAPVLVTSTAVGTAPSSLFIAGRYAYVANGTGNSVSVVDISNPTTPFQIATVVLGASSVIPDSIYVDGRYAYTANNGNNTISAIDVGGEETTSLVAGSADLGTLQVRNDILANGQLQVTGGVDVGQGGIYSAGGLSVGDGISSTLSVFGGRIDIGTSTYQGSSTLVVCGVNNCNLPTTNPSSTNGVALFASANGLTTGVSIVAKGQVVSGLNDIGEYIPVVGGDADYGQGDVVSPTDTSSTEFQRSSVAYDPTVAGIISTTAGLVAGGGDPTHSNTVIALAGRVPVNVTTENGVIHVGDQLTTSNIPGVAMRATEPGRVLGIALAEDDGDPTNPNATSQVMMFVDPHWSLGNLTSTAEIASSSWALEGVSSTQSALDQFTTYVEEALAKLGVVITDGVATLQGIVANNVSTNQLCVQGTCVNGSEFAAMVNGSGGNSTGVSMPSSPSTPSPSITDVSSTTVSSTDPTTSIDPDAGDASSTDGP